MTIKKNLSLAEMNAMFRAVTDTVFDENGEFQYQYRDFYTRIAIIKSYTDAVVPADVSEQYALCYDAMLWDSIMGDIDEVQYNDILIAIDDFISDKKHRMETVAPYRELMGDMGELMTAVAHLNELTAESEVDASLLDEK